MASATGSEIGFKPAGGLRTAKDAINWLILMREELGVAWTRNDLFRIGASGLLTDIERQLEHYATGRYSASLSSCDGVRPHGQDRRHHQDHGLRPLAGGRRRRARLARRARGRLRPFHRRRFTAAGELFDVYDPSTGDAIARVTQGKAADVDAAVAAARAALPGWAALSGPRARAPSLRAGAADVQKRERFLAVLESIDNGKPIRETRDIDVPLVARHFYHHAGWASLIDCEFPGARPSASAARSSPGISRC